jgi:DNA polymerase-3 subunit epsilon
MSPDAGSLVARAAAAGPTPSSVGGEAGAAAPLTGPIGPARFAVVDVETSGLRPDRHRLLQIGVVRVLGDGTVIDRWDTLLKAPWRPLGGRRVHGLSRRVLRGAPRLRAVRADLVRLLDGSILCGHNVEFDWSFLVQGFRRAGYPAPDALRLCTLQLSRSLDPERERSHRLGDLCARYGIELARAHDAAADAAATATVLPQLLAASGIGDLAELAPHLAGSTVRWPEPPRR